MATIVVDPHRCDLGLTAGHQRREMRERLLPEQIEMRIRYDFLRHGQLLLLSVRGQEYCRCPAAARGIRPRSVVTGARLGRSPAPSVFVSGRRESRSAAHYAPR